MSRRDGDYGVSISPTPAELSNNALDRSNLVGPVPEAPVSPESQDVSVNVYEDGDNVITEVSGKPGSTLIPPDSDIETSLQNLINKSSTQEPERVSNEDRLIQGIKELDKRHESNNSSQQANINNARGTQSNNSQISFSRKRTYGSRKTPISISDDNNREQSQNNIPQLSAQSASSNVTVDKTQNKPQVLMRPSVGVSQEFSVGDLGIFPEEDKNPNNSSFNVVQPPIPESENIQQQDEQQLSPQQQPLPQQQTDSVNFKHTQAKNIGKVEFDETNESLIRNDVTKSISTESNEDNIAVPFEPIKRTPKLKTKDVPNSVFYKNERLIKERTTNAVANKNWDGNGFTEKVTASRFVDPGDVSIGSQVILELVREPGNNLINVVNEETGMDYTVEQLISGEGLNSFIDAINQSNIYVVASKSPVPNPSSSQGRRLRVHYGRGVRVHPTQTKIYNLDFDGDGVLIHFETDGSLFRNAMDYLINEMGEPMIDMDFFPMAHITETLDDFVDKFRTSFLRQLSSNIDTDQLAIDLYYVMYPDLASDIKGVNSDKLKKELLLINFIHSMNDVASKYSNKHAVLSYILKDVFDTMLLANQLYIGNAALSNPDVMSDIVEMPADYAVLDTFNEIASGNLPPNFQDFLVGLGRYIGEIPDKNVMFRLGADVAKRVKFSGVTIKGEEGARELYEKTLEAGMAAFMSGRANIGEKIAYIQHVARKLIISKVQFIDSVNNDGAPLYRNLFEWLNTFISWYNYFQGMVDSANIEFGCDLDPIYSSIKNKQIEPNNNGKYGITAKGKTDLIQAIISIYGDYTLERVFPNAFNYIAGLKISSQSGQTIPVHLKGNTLLPRYRRYTLSKLARNNRISTDFDSLKKITIDNATELDILMGIADKRSSKASKFNGELNTLLQNFADGLLDFRKHYRSRTKNPANFFAYVNDVMSCFHISGPDMFAYYGMDNPDSFLNSDYGDLLQRAAGKTKGDKEKHICDNVDYMGGVRMTMVVQYRMRHIQDMNEEIQRLSQEGEPLYDMPRINELQNMIVNELSILGSSSDIWEVLTNEINGNTSAFDILVDTKGECLGKWCDAKELRDANGKKQNFWKKASKKYHSLMDVMMDPNLPKSWKEKIAADVIKQYTGFTTMKAYEINHQLEIGPHSSYTSISTMAYLDQPNVLSDIEKANNRFKRFFENNWEEMSDDVKKAHVTAEEGELENYIKNLAENPEAYMEVPDDLIVDAINAQMDKTSRASEKAHQEMPVSALYNALSNQKGGLTNAVYRSDARVLGMIPERNLSAYDIIQVLSDPNLSFTVYNGDVRYILSREVLCGDTSEESLWKLLENNPRIASLLRPSISSVVSKDGISVYRNAKWGFQESFNTSYTDKDVLRGKVKSELCDHPMFLAMVAMFKPIAGRSSRGVRKQTTDVLNALQIIMIGYGTRAADGEDFNKIKVEKILSRMGVTVESLQKVGGMDETAATNWHTDMIDCMCRYINDVGELIDNGNYQPYAKEILGEENITKLSFDRSSVALAVDVRQTMTGAKTETSTNIEGGMTQENLGLGLWCMSIQDRFTIIDGDMSDSDLEQFVGCMTNAGMIEIEDFGSLGIPGNPGDEGAYNKASSRSVRLRNEKEANSLRRKIEELEMSLPSCVPLIVEMPNYMVRQDETLDQNLGFQIPSIARWAITKRTKAAEEKNLKAKKAGDDGLDSITKSSRYINNAKDNIGIVETIYREAEDKKLGLFNAIIKLAQILQKADIAEGYEDMDLADYANIASLMIKEISDDTGSDIVIRSIGEISLAIRKNMDQSIVEHGTPKEKINNASEIADNVGLQSMIADKFMRNAALLSVSSIRSNAGVGSYKSAKSASMSSPERSFGLMWYLSGKERLEIPWLGKKTTKPSERVKSKSELRKAQSKIKDRLPFDVNESNYNFIGYIGESEDDKGNTLKTEFEVSPGQTSVWYLSSNATQEEIDMALRRCYSYGMTLAFDDISSLGNNAEIFENDITVAPFGDNLVMLPFFDMRLNQSSISGPMAPASFQYDPSWVWYSVEDSLNLYGLGDADALMSGYAVDKTKCIASDVLKINFDDLFYNTRESYPDLVDYPVLCSTEEIQREIIDMRDGGPTIDFGIVDSNPYFETSNEKLKLQIEEYRQAFSTVNNEYGILPEAKPDRIIGWVKCYIKGEENPVYAPIIPWPTGSNLTAPTRFTIEDIQLDDWTDSLSLTWKISEDIEGQFCKVHDGMGAAGKTMVALSRDTDLGTLRNGRPIDMVTAAESFASRRLAWGKRMCTLKTLAITMAMPPYGYNYAEHESSFPDLRNSTNPEDQALLVRLQTERIPIEEWPSIIGSIKKFSTHSDIDSLLRDQIELAIKTGTVNPSDILATKFNDSYTFRYIDYDFMFDTSLNFQNTLMKFYNLMQPDVCPPSIDEYYDRENGKGYLFKPITNNDSDNEYEIGCLQMAVPHKHPVNGKIFYHWENVYASFSFFNDDYSGLHKIGLNGTNRSMEQLNAMAISGKPLEGRNMQLYVENVAAPAFRTYGSHDIQLAYNAFLTKER